MDSHRGVARRIDHLGRIVVPAELRRALGIEPGDELEVATDGPAITLTKVETRCVFCGAERALRPFRAKLVCGRCASELGESPGPDGGEPGGAGSGLAL
ncbi:MAG TPA: AbrB/MazE/SpoVT family DNA-binding domain-containing protein [Acidimicrobiales bacterium]